MDLIKTGKFIQECRKEKKLTQVQLAKEIVVSEKTISKWECGNGFPDTSLILPLCNVLGITANELLSAKKLPDEKEYKKIAEENLITLKSQQEKNAKFLFAIEWVVLFLSVVILVGCCAVVEYIELPTVWRVLIEVFGFMCFFAGIWPCFIIDTKVGFYKCGCCEHKYIPSYKQVLFGVHISRTRYLKCPKCGKRSWNKKVVK